MKFRLPHRLLAPAIALLVLAGCATAPTEYREPTPLSASARSTHNQQVFTRMWELVDDKYFDARFRGVDWAALRPKYEPAAVAAPDEEALYKVLNTMCAELKESHLYAATPRRTHEQRTAHRASVGFRWAMLENVRVVTEVVPGSPAAMAGVQSGWFIVSRNGVPIQENDPYRPQLGQPVTYGFLDEHDETRTLTLQPQLIDFGRIETRDLPGGFVYLRFDEFNRPALRWLSAQLKARRDAPGVVVDLRFNPGGSVFALNMAIAEFFPHPVDAGQVVKRSGRQRDNGSFPWLSAHYAGRVAILTDRVSGSAAEIFSHVLQYHHRAAVIGRPTAGAVIVSRFYALPGGGQLQVPIQDYIGLDGKRLEGRGVTPDLELPAPTLTDYRTHRDLDLATALEALGLPAPPP